MGIITEIRGGKRQGKQVNIFVDGRFALALDAEIAVKEKLEVNKVLEAGRIKELIRADQASRCFNAAIRYLGYRPRSEAELRERLQRRGFTNDIIEIVIDKLKEQNLVDDSVFARFWKENRESFSPRSRTMMQRELRKKGVAEEVSTSIISTIDEEESAYRSAQNKARRLPADDYILFRQRLGGYLKRRGFGYGIIKKTIERIWQEYEEHNSA